MRKEFFSLKALLLIIFGSMAMIAHAQIDEGWLTTQSFQPEMKSVS